ncbi:MAG: NAD(P)H-dependent oxidoreductase [Spirochaetaceae bacterium]|jgi:chromate reductase|nr:NAD(P)H-dependent oxidoreductase [Spirochaetaceae bacterium]
MKKINIGVFAGSLRKGSFCKKIARAVSAAMPDTFEMISVEIGGLALYNQDFDDEKNLPASWVEFRRQIKNLDGFLFVTPEYNRGLSAALKNALDVASRPYGENWWGGKPGAVIGVTIGKLGAFGAYHSLRQTLGFLNVFTLNQPEMYLSSVESFFNEKGELANNETRQFLSDFANRFAAWIMKMKEPNGNGVAP